MENVLSGDNIQKVVIVKVKKSTCMKCWKKLPGVFQICPECTEAVKGKGHKSVIIASVLAIIPGLGLAYLGEYKNAIMMFGLTILFIFIPLMGILFSPFIYLASIGNTISLAVAINRAQIQK